MCMNIYTHFIRGRKHNLDGRFAPIRYCNERVNKS